MHIEAIQENGAEENLWVYEARSKRRLKKLHIKLNVCTLYQT
jgi:hypothetical protein